MGSSRHVFRWCLVIISITPKFVKAAGKPPQLAVILTTTTRLELRLLMLRGRGEKRLFFDMTEVDKAINLINILILVMHVMMLIEVVVVYVKDLVVVLQFLNDGSCGNIGIFISMAAAVTPFRGGQLQTFFSLFVTFSMPLAGKVKTKMG